MTNSGVASVSANITNRFDGATNRIATVIAIEHGCDVHIGWFRNEDTGETSPAFLLNARSTDRVGVRPFEEIDA